MGHAVTQLVKALRYKSEGRGFDSRWCHWNFSFTYSFRPHYDPGVDSASNRNEYQEYFLRGKGVRCVGLTTLPPSCAVVMKYGNLNFLEPSGPLQAPNGAALPLSVHLMLGARGDAVGWGTALQAGRSRVRFPMVSLEIFIYIILPAALWPWDRLSL